MIDLEKPRFLALCALLIEAVWPALWPPLGVAGAFLCVALLDLPSLLPGWAHTALPFATGATILFLLYRELSRVRLPGPADADRRLEAASGLSHRPLSVVTGRPTWTDATSLALWEAHRERAAAQIAQLKIGTPRPGLARRDRRALRAGLVVSLVACGVVAGRDAPSRVVAALVPIFSAPGSRFAVKRIVVDGNLAVIHLHGRSGAEGAGGAVADIYRLAGGRIVEHWDVLQPIEPSTANPHPYF